MAKAVELYREALGEFLPDARIQGDPEVAELEGVKYVRLTIEVDPALYGNVDDVLGVKERIFDYVYEKNVSMLGSVSLNFVPCHY